MFFCAWQENPPLAADICAALKLQKGMPTAPCELDIPAPPALAATHHSGSAHAWRAGQIFAGQGPPQGVQSEPIIAAKPLCEKLEKAGADEAIKAVVLRIDSPGGCRLCILNHALAGRAWHWLGADAKQHCTA